MTVKPAKPVVMTRDEWLEKAKELFGPDFKKWRFKCPICHNTQTYEDFVEAGVEKPQDKVYFSCIGRWTGGADAFSRDGSSGDESPCNYTCGGLFRLGGTTIKLDDEDINIFDFAEQS